MAKHFNFAMKEAREAEGLSLQELAKRCGVTDSWLWKIEKGKSRPSEALRISIKAALGMIAPKVIPTAAKGRTAVNKNTTKLQDRKGTRPLKVIGEVEVTDPLLYKSDNDKVEAELTKDTPTYFVSSDLVPWGDLTDDEVKTCQWALQAISTDPRINARDIMRRMFEVYEAATNTKLVNL